MFEGFNGEHCCSLQAVHSLSVWLEPWQYTLLGFSERWKCFKNTCVLCWLDVFGEKKPLFWYEKTKKITLWSFGNRDRGSWMPSSSLITLLFISWAVLRCLCNYLSTDFRCYKDISHQVRHFEAPFMTQGLPVIPVPCFCFPSEQIAPLYPFSAWPHHHPQKSDPSQCSCCSLMEH